ncbi:phosphoesterase [Trinickia symbiotica]|uniref:phospholipase C n=1 Tax=Trinickia symbiotica TaxID=863227 RepID=A0A2T3XJX3_9BURK|nr:alkaline phosphatase family protein [Trinickia symbiotica]PTB16834.1 phosphoesterase [Trinickia symbiotica]
MNNVSAHRGFDRRSFLAGMAAMAGGVVLSGCGGGKQNTPNGSAPAPSIGDVPSPDAGDRYSLPRPPLPDPAASNVDFIVLVTMENRSFDHFIGWVSGAEGMPANQQYNDAFGSPQTPFLLSANPSYGYQACGHAQPDHSYEGARTQLASGAMNGWLLTPDTNKTRGDLYPIGFYGQSDLDFFRGEASSYAVCDFFFSGLLGPTFPNRIYLHSGATDRLTDSTDKCTLPTIWDRFADAKVSAKYYFHDVPIVALYGDRYVGISRLFSDFLSDAKAGTLPSFCMVDPSFIGEDEGTANDDHPFADIRNGEVLLGQIYDALRTGPNWSRTLMIIVYDEYGGFFEHVVPPIRPISNAELALGNDGRLGFRVPCALLGPRVAAGKVSRYPFDPSSIHALLQWRFGLQPLGVRGSDPATFNLAYALEFGAVPRSDAPPIAVTQGTFGGLCAGATQPSSSSSPSAIDKSQSAVSAMPGSMAELRARADSLGFPRP